MLDIEWSLSFNIVTKGSINTSTVSTLLTDHPPPQCCCLLSECSLSLLAISLFQLEFSFRKQDIKWLTESLEGLKELTIECVSGNSLQSHTSELSCLGAADPVKVRKLRKLTPQPLSQEPLTSVMSTLATWWLCILSLSIHDSKFSSFEW